jgi:type I restriction enzyme S subunit
MPHYENVPFEISDSWVWTTLGEISNYGDSNNVSVTDIADNEWILELEDLEKDTASIIQILSKKERSIKGVRHKFKEGDVLYSKLRTYLNKVLVAPQIGYCTTEIIPFNSYCGISTHYLCHVLRSAYFLDYTQQCGYGVKMPRLSTNDACKGMIPLPPLAEQHRIVAEIERWFSLIDIIETGKDDLQTAIKQTKSKVLDLAIHGKLVPQDPNDEPAIELLKRINPDFTPCDNGHSEKLPQNWTWAKGINIFLPMKSTKPKDEEFQYIDIDSIDNKRQIINGIKTLKTSKAPSRASRYTQKNDVIFSMVRPYLRNIAKVIDDNCIASTGFYVCSPTPKLLNSDYCYYLMISEYVVDGLNQFMKGDNSPSISKGHIDEWLFPLPPFAEQQRIVQKIEALFSVLDNIQNALEV